MSDEEDIAQPFAANSDLFDAEIDSEPEEGNGILYIEEGEQQDGGELENSIINDEDDCARNSSDGEEEDSTKEDKKTKKIREPKKRRVKKIEVQQIHSDSQRLVREYPAITTCVKAVEQLVIKESNVKLPYHWPANRDINHFLKRIPVNKKNIQKKQKCKSDKDAGNSLNADNPNLKTQPSSPPPVAEIICGANDAEPDDTAVKPQLSMATDTFFLDDSSTKKSAGMNHFMERFFKHAEAKTTQKKTELLSKEPEEIKPPAILVEDLNETDESIKMKANIPLGTGNNLTSLKGKLQENMKFQRTKIRKIHESQRKIDNEEVSDEEEEEEEDFEDEDEDDTDFEVDKWNSEDEKEQEQRENDMEEQASDKNDDDIGHHETSDVGLNDESNSMADSELSYQKTKLFKNIAEEDEHRDKIHVYSDEKTMDLFSSDTSNQNTTQTGELTEDMNDSDSKESNRSIKLRLDSVDDSEDTHMNKNEKESEPLTYTKLKLPLSSHAQESSDGSLIPDAQQQSEKKLDKKNWNNLDTGTDFLTPFSRIQKFLGVDCSLQTKEKKSKPLSELTLPVEDSQDLYDHEDEEDKREEDSMNVSKEFHFALDEDTQFTQFVDTQGYLVSSSKKRKVTENVSEEKSNMSELLGLCSGTFTDQPKPKSDAANLERNMSELLGLCSGKFPDQAATKSNFSSQNGSGYDMSEIKHDHNMSELLGLCSGRFSGLENSKGSETKSESESGIFSAPEQTKERKLSRSKQGLSAMFDAIAEQNNFDDVIALCSGKFPTTQKSPQEIIHEPEDENINESQDGVDSSDEEVFSDDANERQESDDENDDSDNDDLLKSKKYGITYGKQTNAIFDKNNFVEEEAEMSGSDFSSDEEEGCGDDELEEDSEVEDLPSEEELQRQVNKVHMKSLIDEDKRDLRAFKERYLEDGDLYSEGGRRSRNFKWHGLDDSQLELFGKKVLWGEEEVVDNELLSQAELERRKMKHEKDQFLQEQLQHEKNSENTDVDENSQNILNLIKDTSNATSDMKKVSNEKPTPKPQDSKSTKASLKRGSFLNRSKDQLSKLSSITVAKKTPNSTRGFVFHTISPGAKTKENVTKKLERSVSLSEPPNPKRPRLEKSFSNVATGSLFSMMS